MVMKKHGNVRGEIRVNFLALFASKPHILMCGALKLSGIVRANVRLDIAIAMFFLSLTSLAKHRRFRNSRPIDGAKAPRIYIRRKITSNEDFTSFWICPSLRLPLNAL